jgi:hypothetical protein
MEILVGRKNTFLLCLRALVRVLSQMILLLLACVVLSLGCVEYQAAALTTSTCALQNSTGIYFNKQGCPTNYECTIEGLNIYFANSSRDSYECQVATSQSTDDLVWPNKQEDNKDLLEGSHPKICANSTECLLQDGNSSDCLCGLNGHAYCQPDFSSSVFQDYWDSQYTIGGLLNQTSLYEYMRLLYKLYPYVSGSAEYAADFFKDLKHFKEVEAEATESNSEDSTTTDGNSLESTTELTQNVTSVDDEESDSGAGLLVLEVMLITASLL